MIEKNYLKKIDICFGIRYTNQINLLVWHAKWIPLLKSNNVKYRQILSNNGHFETFWDILAIFYCFLLYLTLTNKKNYSFWINFSDLDQIIHSFWFVGIQHYSTNYGKSCQIICFNSFCFNLSYDLNHLFFIRFDLF